MQSSQSDQIKGYNLRISGRRGVRQCDRAVDSIGTRGRFLVLPHPPDTVDLGVVQVEPRIAVGGNEIAARIAANGEVTGGVHAHEIVFEGWDTALHVRPEALDVLALEQADDLLVIGPLAGGPWGDVTLQASRVVAKTQEWCLLGVGEVAVRVWSHACGTGEDGTQVHAKTFEGTIFETAAAFTVGDEDIWLIIGRYAIALLLSAAQLAVTAHACRASIQCRRRCGISSPHWPVVVWLVAIVSALVPQDLFVRPCEESVPSEEVASVMHRKGLIDVCRNEVIVTTADARCYGQWCLCFKFAQAFHCFDVFLPLGLCQLTPV